MTREITQAPTLAPEVRTQMLGALYDQSYAQVMPRDRFDASVGSKSDLDIANATYSAFYEGRLPRTQFNERIGLTSARGSTRAAIMQGVSFGLADEVGAGAAAAVEGVGGLLSGQGFSQFAPAYDRALTGQRQNLEVFRQNNPYLGAGLEVAGGLVSGGAATGPGLNAVRSAPAVAPSTGRIVATAAGMGAAQGFGQGEGVEDRLTGAAVGGALGASFAAAVPTILRLAGGGVGRGIQAAGLGDSEEAAARMLLRAMEQDGMTPLQAVGRLNQWQRSGAKPETLFDIGGENTRRLARASAGQIGPGTDRATTFLAERQAGQAGRIADDAATGLGQSADDFFSRRAALTESRRTAAAPLYERAFRIQPTPDEYANVARFVEDPIGQQALRRGLRVIELEDIAANRTFDPAAYGVQRINGELVPIEGGTPNMRLLDAVKRGFDDIVEGFRDPTSGRLNLDQYGRAVDQARGAYRNTLAGMFHPYRRALEAYSGPSQLMDGMARGRNLFNMRDAEAAQAAVTVRANPSEAEAFRLGAAQAIQEAIERAPDGADVVKRIFGSPAKRALIRASFPTQEAFDQFQQQMTREAAMYRNAQFVSPRTGSQTQLRQADAEGFGGIAADAALGAIVPGQSMAGAAVGGMRRMADRASGVTPAVADGLSRRLFTSETPDVVQTLRELNQRRMRDAAARLRAQRTTGAVYPAITSGGVAGLE